TYTEKQVNELLGRVYPDYAEIRRYLVDYALLDRKQDGSEYWLRDLGESAQTQSKDKAAKGAAKGENKGMNRRKELQEQAKEVKIEAGIYCIRNERNGKVFVDSTPNLKTINGQKFMLQMGTHLNRQLQAEWK
ncbi:transcriptional regulator, partial [Escherichia coli]|nr:transcriptional regulator [Escherichia coli]